jgi:hypothetical protein
MIATWWGLPIGDWASWAAAFVSLLAFGAVVVGLFVEGSRRKSDIARLDAQRHEDRVGEQARLIGAYVKPGSLQPAALQGHDRWIAVITNASKLPIHNVVGQLFDRDGVTTHHAVGPTRTACLKPPTSSQSCPSRRAQPITRLGTKSPLSVLY